jgi:hypothetical protein
LDSSTLQTFQTYGGFLYEDEPVPADDRIHQDPRGAAISPLFVTARIYPSKMSTFHLRVGGGFVNAWSNPAGTSSWGSGAEAGVGYDVRVRRRLYITPFAMFFGGKAGEVDLRAITVGAGCTWR